MGTAHQVYESHVWIRNLTLLVSNADFATDSLCGSRYTSTPCFIPLWYRSVETNRELLLYSLARHSPEGWFEPLGTRHTVLKTVSLPASLDNQPELHLFRLQEKTYTCPFFLCMLFPWDFSEMQVPEAALSQLTHTGVSPCAKSWMGHTKAPHGFFLAKTVTGAGSSLPASGLERGKATGFSCLPSTATKTWVCKEGGQEQLAGGRPGARHPPHLLQLGKELKRHGSKSQSIKFIEGN